jgi:hypothetical protein
MSLWLLVVREIGNRAYIWDPSFPEAKLLLPQQAALNTSCFDFDESIITI